MYGLTAVPVEDAGEAVQAAIAAAAVGATLLDPLPVRNQSTAPGENRLSFRERRIADCLPFIDNNTNSA